MLPELTIVALRFAGQRIEYKGRDALLHPNLASKCHDRPLEVRRYATLRFQGLDPVSCKQSRQGRAQIKIAVASRQLMFEYLHESFYRVPNENIDILISTSISSG